MGVLVDDLLLLARLDQGRPLERTPVDLEVLVTDAVSDARAADPARTVTERIDAAGARGGRRHAPAPGARQPGAQRARAHAAGNARSRWRCSARATSAVIEVIDHGPGIARDHAQRIFERFHRSDPGRSRDQGGSGLGLSIVDAVVTAHGGTIRVDDTPGGGATFRIELPALAGGAARSRCRRDRARPSIPRPPDRGFTASAQPSPRSHPARRPHAEPHERHAPLVHDARCRSRRAPSVQRHGGARTAHQLALRDARLAAFRHRRPAPRHLPAGAGVPGAAHRHRRGRPVHAPGHHRRDGAVRLLLPHLLARPRDRRVRADGGHRRHQPAPPAHRCARLARGALAGVPVLAGRCAPRHRHRHRRVDPVDDRVSRWCRSALCCWRWRGGGASRTTPSPPSGAWGATAWPGPSDEKPARRPRRARGHGDARRARRPARGAPARWRRAARRSSTPAACAAAAAAPSPWPPMAIRRRTGRVRARCSSTAPRASH